MELSQTVSYEIEQNVQACRT